MFEPGKFFHVYNRGNNKEVLFVDTENYNFFLEKVKLHLSPIAYFYAYCLMPNHFHLLVRIKEEHEIPQKYIDKSYKNLSFPFSNLFNSYTKAFNRRQNRIGKLFSQLFKKINIDSDEYLTTIVQYIHRNPIHHNYVSNINSWEHSSYHALLSEGDTKLNRIEVLDWFGGKQKFIDSHQEMVDYYKINSFVIE